MRDDLQGMRDKVTELEIKLDHVCESTQTISIAHTSMIMWESGMVAFL